MDRETHCLSWKDFPYHLARTFGHLLTGGHFADVTLVSDDQIQVKAHKLVLSACSPVLKNLLLNNPHSHPLLYLRGVKQQELQSILQFMYFGEATIYQDRINEFMVIAKDLEVKEISKDDESDEEFVKSEADNVEKPMDDNQTRSVSSTNDQLLDLNFPEYDDSNDRKVVTNSQSYNCQDCEAVFTTKPGLQYHYRSKHEGVRYSCSECKYQATQQSSLRTHQQSVHEGVRYSCNQCEYQATHQGHLKTHQQVKHEGIRLGCPDIPKSY